jgi:hypothetical protein
MQGPVSGQTIRGSPARQGISEPSREERVLGDRAVGPATDSLNVLAPLLERPVTVSERRRGDRAIIDDDGGARVVVPVVDGPALVGAEVARVNSCLLPGGTLFGSAFVDGHGSVADDASWRANARRDSPHLRKIGQRRVRPCEIQYSASTIKPFLRENNRVGNGSDSGT